MCPPFEPKSVPSAPTSGRKSPAPAPPAIGGANLQHRYRREEAQRRDGVEYLLEQPACDIISAAHLTRRCRSLGARSDNARHNGPWLVGSSCCLAFVPVFDPGPTERALLSTVSVEDHVHDPLHLVELSRVQGVGHLDMGVAFPLDRDA
jgi:hypothetical protein